MCGLSLRKEIDQPSSYITASTSLDRREVELSKWLFNRHLIRGHECYVSSEH